MLTTADHGVAQDGPYMVAGDGTNADYEAFAVNDDNSGDLKSYQPNITIGAKDSGFNGATTFTHLLVMNSHNRYVC